MADQLSLFPTPEPERAPASDPPALGPAPVSLDIIELARQLPASLASTLTIQVAPWISGLRGLLEDRLEPLRRAVLFLLYSDHAAPVFPWIEQQTLSGPQLARALDHRSHALHELAMAQERKRHLRIALRADRVEDERQLGVTRDAHAADCGGPRAGDPETLQSRAALISNTKTPE